MLQLDDQLEDVLSPRQRAHGGFGRESPTLRHPKARRSLLGSDAPGGAEEMFGSGGYGRSSPNPFQPIRGRSSPAPLGEGDGFSMAGQTNVDELRRASLRTGYDPEPMIKACVKVFVTR